MPNHIQNRLQFIASPDRVKEVRGDIAGKFDSGERMTIDFNKIKKCPDALNIQIHSGIEMMVKDALKMSSHENELIASLELYNRSKTPSALTLNDEEWTLFIQALNNVREHQHMYWYSWNTANWGTKWNAYQQDDKRDTEDTIYFQTAWSSPIDLMFELHKMYSDVKMILTYADEDAGSNTGIVTFDSGVMGISNPISQSLPAWGIYFDLHPEDVQCYELIGGEYRYKEEEID